MAKAISPEAKAVFERVYKDAWADRISTNPVVGDMLLSYCQVTLEQREIEAEVDAMRERGEPTTWVTLENGCISAHPIQGVLKAVRAEVRALSKALGTDHSKKNSSKTGKGSFASIVGKGK